MKFEDILKIKLKEVTQRVYPIVAPEGIKAPFIVFKQRNLKNIKTLDGYIRFIEGYYEIVLIANNYDELIENKDSIKERVISLIGVKDEIFINDIDIEFNGDNYVYDINAFQSNITLTIKYRESGESGI